MHKHFFIFFKTILFIVWYWKQKYINVFKNAKIKIGCLSPSDRPPPPSRACDLTVGSFTNHKCMWYPCATFSYHNVRIGYRLRGNPTLHTDVRNVSACLDVDGFYRVRRGSISRQSLFFYARVGFFVLKQKAALGYVGSIPPICYGAVFINGRTCVKTRNRSFSLLTRLPTRVEHAYGCFF